MRYQIHCIVSKNDAVTIVIEDDCHATMFQCRSAQERFAHVHHVKCDLDQDSFSTVRHHVPVQTVALSSGESEMYALGALSAELIFAQAILKEIGLSFLIHARADSSTARAVATKQGASRKMKHIQTRFVFIQILVFRKLLTMSSVKTDVNPSDIGTKALGRERFRSMLGMGIELSETTSPSKWYSGNE